MSDSKEAFADALKEYGYTLARGDRRGFIAVDTEGEVFSLSRWTGLKTKQLKDPLGNPNSLPSTASTKINMANQITNRLRNYMEQVKKETKMALEPVFREKRHQRSPTDVKIRC